MEKVTELNRVRKEKLFRGIADTFRIETNRIEQMHTGRAQLHLKRYLAAELDAVLEVVSV